MESEVIMADKFKASGITENTPKNIMFGAGTIHAGLFFGDHYFITEDKVKQSDKKYYIQNVSSTSSPDEAPVITFTEFGGSEFLSNEIYWEKYTGWNAADTIIGATSGGTKLTITPEISDIEVDGATVKVEGLAVKTGETAKFETNLIEVTPYLLKSMVVGSEKSPSAATGYTEIVSTQRISEGNYVKNLGYVGKTLDGRAIIVTFDIALCTSGLEVEGKNKESSTLKATFECYANLSEDPTTLPYHIYYPKSTE